MSIPIVQARQLFTQATLAVYKERVPATSFLRSFFQTKTSTEKYVDIEVQRGTRKIAVDVGRGIPGKRNTFSYSSLKVFMPPMHNQNFDATQLDRYDKVFGEDAQPSNPVIGYLGSDVAEKYIAIRDKIERAKELQAAEVFETGVVAINAGTDIDYKRKATSLKDNSGAPWSTVTSDIEGQLITGCEFIRKDGKSIANEFDAIMPSAVFLNLKKSNYFKDNANFKQVQLVDIKRPQAVSSGASYHGQIIAGAFIINIWTYDEGYDDADGVYTPYLHAKKVILIPSNGTRFIMAHAGIPAIMREFKS